MLEIKNITKIYHSKHAQDVVALNNVSINFGDRGLVFLLGKSGSGKSTILNTIGGLDAFDQGEVIINGRSSKTFTQQDFDSYRNTYIGFVFQEYNVLPEFSVEKNISLAIELQGKTPDKQAVENLLEQVDMKGYGKRKPNQLSGGQKQRLAIARALIKDPQIIMADEPTGALDSKTGRQVFETLKKLAERKLVIVVSHDRENAEIYADRIIELKDGKIISDQTKHYKAPKQATQNVKVVNNNIIHIKKDHELNVNERRALDKLLTQSKDEIFICTNPMVNTEIKRLAKIDDDGNSTVYTQTEYNDIKKDNTPKKFELIKSRLRTRDAVKMGYSSLKNKKGKLIVAIILTLIAMLVFGFSDTMASFDAEQNMYESIINADSDYVSIKKVLNSSNYGETEYISDHDANFTEDDIVELKEKYPNHTFVCGQEISLNTYYIRDFSYDYYLDFSSGFILSSQEYNDLNLKLAYGRYPTNSKEVAITQLQFDIYKTYGYKQNNSNNATSKEIYSYSDIIGCQLGTSYYYGDDDDDYSLTIVGVIDTKLPDTIHNLIFSQQSSNELQLYLYSDYLRYGLHTALFFANQDDMDNYTSNSNNIFGWDSDNNYFSFELHLDANQIKDKCFFRNGYSKVGNLEFVVDLSVVYEDNKYCIKISDNTIRYDSITELENGLKEFVNSNEFKNESEFTLEIYGNTVTIKIIGVTYTLAESLYGGNTLHTIPTKDLGIYVASFGTYRNVITNMTNSNEDKELIYACSAIDSTEDRFLIQNEASGILYNFYDAIKVLAEVFKYVGIVFALFSTLLVMSYIGNSISYKKKEIGILRALGARGSDVYRIFTWESLIILAIVCVLSCVCLGIGCFIVNMSMRTQLGIYLSLLSFGIRQILLLSGLCLAIGLIASFLPTRKITKMQPIDAIQERK